MLASRPVNRAKLLIPAALAAGVLVFGLSACGDDAAKLPDGVVAQVGDAEISQAALDEALAQAKASAESQGQTFPQADTPEYTQAEQQTLEGLVIEEVVQFEARKCGPPCAVTDAEVTAALDEIVQTNFGGDRKEFNKFLKQQKITRAKARELVRYQEQQEKLYNQVTRGVRFSRADAKAYYEQNPDQFRVAKGRTARHILVKTKAEADRIRAQVTADNFAELAKQYSTDTGSKQQGGDLGQIQRGQLVPEFEKVAFALKDGEISQPVKTQFGWHIITVDITPARVTPFDEAVDGIISQQLEAERQETWTTWRDAVLEEWRARTVYADSDLEPPSTTDAETTTAPAQTDG